MLRETRTDALSSGMVNRPPGVARLTFRDTVHRTISTGFPHAIVACARIPYEIQMHTRPQTTYIALLALLV